MNDPSKRFLTIVLALGVVVLLAAIALGERMGDRVIGQVTEKRLRAVAPVAITPAPGESTAPYSPDWKRSQVMAVATDPGFPDPRVPPVALPTAAPPATPHPAATATAQPSASPTPNLNIPIWRRSLPLPTALPSGPPGTAPAAGGSPTAPPSHSS